MSIQPCAVCGKDAGPTRWTALTFLIFNAYLCEKCFGKRVAALACVDCGDKYLDPSYEKFAAYKRPTRNTYVLPNKWLRGKPLICSWCALFRGDMRFIEKRIPPRRQEERILTTELGIVEQEDEYPTIEEYERQRTQIPEVEYIFLPRGKSDIEERRFNYFKGEDTPGKGKKGYFIRYTGYVWQTCNEPPPLESIQRIPSIEPLIHHPDDARKLVHICRIQFFHRDCRGYAEAFWDSRPSSIHVKNVNPNNADKENKILLGARALLPHQSKLVRRPGPKGPRKLTNLTRDEALAGFAYLWAVHEREGWEAPTWTTLQAYYEVSRTKFWEWRKDNQLVEDDDWERFMQEAKEVAAKLDLAAIESHLTRLK